MLMKNYVTIISQEVAYGTIWGVLLMVESNVAMHRHDHNQPSVTAQKAQFDNRLKTR
jgi:hypothetical protein